MQNKNAFLGSLDERGLTFSHGLRLLDSPQALAGSRNPSSRGGALQAYCSFGHSLVAEDYGPFLYFLLYQWTKYQVSCREKLQ